MSRARSPAVEVAGALAPPLMKPEAAMDGRGRDGGKWGSRDEVAKAAPLTPMMVPSLALAKATAMAKATARAKARATPRGPPSWKYEHSL